MDTVRSLKISASDPTTINIEIANGAHTHLAVMPSGCGYGCEIVVFHPTEEDLLRIITGASEGLAALRNAQKES